MRNDQQGQTTAEYVAVVVLVAAIILTLGVSGLAGSVTATLSQAFCTISTTGCDTASTPPTGSGTPGEQTGSGGAGDGPPPDGGAADGPQSGGSEDDGGILDFIGDGIDWIGDGIGGGIDWIGDLFGGGDGDDDDQPPTYEQQLHDLLDDTPLGRTALEQQERYDVEVEYHDGGGSYYTPATNTFVIDSSLPPEQQMATFVHEMNHARYSNEGLSADIEEVDREVYVDRQVDEEVEGVVLQIEANQQLQGARQDDAIPDTVFQEPYEEAYRDAVRAAERDAAEDGRTLTASERRRIGEQAGRERIDRAFRDGEVITSTTGETYPEYYGSQWDEAN